MAKTTKKTITFPDEVLKIAETESKKIFGKENISDWICSLILKAKKK